LQYLTACRLLISIGIPPPNRIPYKKSEHIFTNCPVHGTIQNVNPFRLGLCDQKPVERIAMMKRQERKGDSSIDTHSGEVYILLYEESFLEA
jgi:hypothetical protein